VRIFKTKTLAKFTRQHGISDDGLVDAVERAVRGLIDADLGGQIIKQRVARPGQGKRGGFRMIIGIRSDRAIFLFAFAKNERENIDKAELMSLREIVASFLNAAEETIAQALKDGTLIEVQHGIESKEGKGEHKNDQGKDQSAN
jgi:hypothetical protein